MPSSTATTPGLRLTRRTITNKPFAYRNRGFMRRHLAVATFLPRSRRSFSRLIAGMAQTATNSGIEFDRVEEKGTPEKKETEDLPPEKPLPGDCCGSGCVRCVWDVYYEELEEYNNRRKKKDDESDPRSE